MARKVVIVVGLLMCVSGQVMGGSLRGPERVQGDIRRPEGRRPVIGQKMWRMGEVAGQKGRPKAVGPYWEKRGYGEEIRAQMQGLDQRTLELMEKHLKEKEKQWLPQNKKKFDVPQIECPPGHDDVQKLPCPTVDKKGRFKCIEDVVLCDGFLDCPNGEDEDRQSCLFFKTAKSHVDVVADAVLRWTHEKDLKR